MSTVTVAATQMACTNNADENIANAERIVREAVDQGAQIVLLQELFQNLYFCQVEDPKYFNLAKPLDGNPVLSHFQALAKELAVVLPISFFEKATNAHFNSVAIVDATGDCLGVYRKSHIPHGFGYQEKFYFNPGDTGFKVWDTAVGRIGCGICWDQWFPECARAMAVQGADILLYPTAIGSELSGEAPDSAGKWQRAMQGHAAVNSVIVVAANRIGREHVGKGGTHLDFYGSSFVAGPDGSIVAEASRDTEQIVLGTFDLDSVREERAEWGYFRDRRPELYSDLLVLGS